MKNSILIISILSLLACSQNQVDDSVVVDEPVVQDTQDTFVDNALSVLEELSEYYPPEDIDLVLRKIDSNGLQTATFSLKGETKETIELGSFAEKQYASLSKGGTTCSNKWECGKRIKECLDEGDDALISNGACVSSAWCVECVEN